MWLLITVNTCLKAALCSVLCAIIEILRVSLTFHIEIKLFSLSHRLNVRKTSHVRFAHLSMAQWHSTSPMLH